MLTIPYDPAIALGNLVTPDIFERVQALSAASAPANNAQDSLNTLLMAKRSFDMTIQEILQMQNGLEKLTDIPELGALQDQKKALDKLLLQAAADYANKTVEAQKALITLKGSRSTNSVYVMVESPLDYNRSKIITMPLSADSVTCDAQFFQRESNEQAANTMAAKISSYVAGKASYLGDQVSAQVSRSVSDSVSSQYENHNIVGTLVITAGCTHKNAQVLAPLIIDPDKGIRAWNYLFPQDKISTDNPHALVAQVAADSALPTPEKSMLLVSGATYGSSFVGMVHIVNNSETTSRQNMFTMAQNMDATMQIGSYFASLSGGFGVDSTFADSVKSLLSSQTLSSHCSIVTMGVIPSIASNEVDKEVKKFVKFDGADMMEQLVTLQNREAADMTSVVTQANAARTGAQMASLQAGKISAVMTGLQVIDEKKNRMLDINSMFTAFEDYVKKVIEGKDSIFGVPINYYIKPITKSALAHLWVSKYYPQYLAISEDDSKPAGNPPGDSSGTNSTNNS